MVMEAMTLLAATGTALIERITKETAVQVSLSLDGGPLDKLAAHSAFANSPHAVPPRLSQTRSRSIMLVRAPLISRSGCGRV